MTRLMSKAAFTPKLIDRVCAWARRHPLLFSFLLVLLLDLATISISHIGYGTNDDPGMAMRAAGVSKLDTPTEYLFNSNVLVGYALNALYDSVSGMPWYALYLIALQFLATSIMLFAVVRVRFSLTRLLLFLLYYAVAEVFFRLYLQFTQVSLMLALSSSLLLLSELRRERGSRPSWKVLATCVLLYCCAGLVREKSLLLAVGVSLLPISLALWKLKSLAALKRVLAAGAALGLLATALHSYDVRHYTVSEEWRSFYEGKKAKAQIIDFDNVYWHPETKQYFDEIGWSYNDFLMMRFWFYADDEQYSLEKIRQLSSHFPKHKGQEQDVPIGKILAQVAGSVDGMLALLLALLMFCSWRRLEMISILGTALLLAGIIVSMSYFMKTPPERVYLPLSAFVVALALVYSDQSLRIGKRAGESAAAETKRWYPPVALQVAALGMAVYFACVVTNANSKSSRFHQKAQASLTGIMEEMDPQPDELFLTWGDSFPYQWVPALVPIREFYGDFKTVGIGVGLRSPISRARLREFGVENVYTDIIDRPDIFLITLSGEQDLFPLYARYVEEHYQTIVTRELRYAGPFFNAVRIRTAG